MKDPVCYVNVQNDEFTYKIEDEIFFFCSKECLEKFENHPKKFVKDYIFDDACLLYSNASTGLS